MLIGATLLTTKINDMTKMEATTGVSDLDARKKVAKTEPEFKSGIEFVKKRANTPIKIGDKSFRVIDPITKRKFRLLNKTIEIKEYATINDEWTKNNPFGSVGKFEKLLATTPAITANKTPA